MAIYQFQLIVIPKEGVLNKLGFIPNKLTIDYKERTEYYRLKKEEFLIDKVEFIDALIQNWWKDIEVEPIEIIKHFDKYVKRADYGNKLFINWKYYSEKVDNDASMSIRDSAGEIETLRFRADLREHNLKFLKSMIELANEYDWLLMDINGNLVKPEFDEVVKLIKKSNSYRFLQSPTKFFDDIESGKIKIE